MKKIWTEKDFESMGWHDSYIHAIQYDYENFKLYLDIDYIFEWSRKSNDLFNFTISPATLIFENVWDLKFESEFNSKVEINEIIRNNPTSPKNADFIEKKTEWDWQIDLLEGGIYFKSVGYSQIIRKPPIIQESQFLERKELNEYLKSVFFSDFNTLIL